MRPIDKFILHVVHNLFPLNEYSQGILDKIIQHYSEEAEDLYPDKNISNEQLKTWIENFERVKRDIIAKGGTDLIRPGKGGELEFLVPLAKLIKIATSFKGAKGTEEKEDETPDMVYNDNGITIWNGAKQGNCITYGASQQLPNGSKWCITMPGGSYWGSYRYGESYKYPTFYLAKNNNLPDSDKLSFVALQVLIDGTYKFTNRYNSPGMEGPFTWEELNNKIPWLRSIPDIKNILKYIPLSSQEKATQIYKNKSISVGEWLKLSPEQKTQYLIVRSNTASGTFFSNISNEKFIISYLPDYPFVATFIAGTSGIVPIDDLISNIGYFKKSDQSSIIKQLRDKVKIDILSDDIPFDAKKALVYGDHISIPRNQKLYVTKDKSAIVRLILDDKIKITLYTEDDTIPKIKINKNTSKYLLYYPELDKIPFNTLMDLATEGVIDKSVLKQIIEKAKTDENSTITIKNIDGNEILIDSNSLTAYDIGSDKIEKLPFNDEKIQKVFTDEEGNNSLQQNAVNIITTSLDTGNNIPASVDMEALKTLLKVTPYDKKTFEYNDTNQVVLTTDDENPSIIIIPTTKYVNRTSVLGYENKAFIRYRAMDSPSLWKSYFNYLRSKNETYSDSELISFIGSGNMPQTKRSFIKAKPPLSPTGRYGVGEYQDNYYIVNKENPRESMMLGSRDKPKKAPLTPAQANTILGTPQAAQAAQPAAGRRGRPAGVPNAPRAAQPAAAGGDINVSDVMEETGLGTAFLRLPRPDYRRLAVTDARRENPNNSRGATRVNNRLGGAGSVGRIISVGESKIYIIRLANQQIMATINVQPGNRNYALFGNEQGNVMISMNSPGELMQVLQQRNLAEVRNYLVREYLANNPQHLDEVRNLIRQHVNETKKR